MKIVLFGKKGCGKCDSAEDKLKRMKLQYHKRDYEALTNDPVPWSKAAGVERWELIEAGVIWALGDGDMPIFVIDGHGYSYPQAMKLLKHPTLINKGQTWMIK